jgi:hypothetical protein
MHQLDIFDDSAERMRLNDLAEAIGRDDGAAAQWAEQALTADFPDNPHRASAARLIAALMDQDTAPWVDLDSAVAARRHVEQQLAPAAIDVLGAADAAPWLGRRWRALAQRARGLAFDRQRATGHAAALWREAAAWADMAAAVQSIPSWRRLPQPLAWMAEARFHSDGLDALWPLLAELCWLAPQRVPPLLSALPDGRLHKWQRRYEDELEVDLSVEVDGAAWLPAWLVVDHPLRVEPLAQAHAVGDSDAERSFRLVAALVRLERQGRQHELVAQRKQLRDLHPVLFALYMKTR